MVIHRADLFRSICRNEMASKMKLENGHVLLVPSSLTQPLQRHDNLDFMVCTELVQTFRNGAESNAAKVQVTAQWLHIKPAVHGTETPALMLTWHQPVASEHAQPRLKELASVQSNFQRSWKKTSWLVSSVGFWAQMPRQVAHARKTFLLPMTAWLHATYHGSRQEKRRNPPLTNALQWCAVIPATPPYFKLCSTTSWSLRNAWQLKQNATACQCLWLGLLTDQPTTPALHWKGSFAT